MHLFPVTLNLAWIEISHIYPIIFVSIKHTQTDANIGVYLIQLICWLQSKISCLSNQLNDMGNVLIWLSGMVYFVFYTIYFMITCLILKHCKHDSKRCACSVVISPLTCTVLAVYCLTYLGQSRTRIYCYPGDGNNSSSL